MTKIFQIASIILALFILCAPSCEDEQALTNREETIISNEKKEIREEYQNIQNVQTLPDSQRTRGQ